MLCNVCGKESGKYPLCRECNDKRATGEVQKCSACGTWYNTAQPCPKCGNAIHHAAPISATFPRPAEPFLYEVKPSLITENEKQYLSAILKCLGDEYIVFPQVNLASIVERTDNAKYRNELFRNIDFLITDTRYKPRLAIEINDQTHNSPDRKKRDERVAQICEEAGLPLLRLWTSYGINENYIREKIHEKLSAPTIRVKHFYGSAAAAETHEYSAYPTPKIKNGCYIATAVYKSYDCPQVWVLRRFRDNQLAKSMLGRAFIRVYYAVSPALVRLHGDQLKKSALLRRFLDKFVSYLHNKGYADTPYTDKT